MFLIILSIFILIIILIGLFSKPKDRPEYKPPEPYKPDETEIKKAGKKGEAYALQIINRYKRQEDLLLSNLNINYRGRKCELDHLLITTSGCFIFECKNYSGRLIGNEDDNEWKQITDYKNHYVKNPIKQVCREIDILQDYLDSLNIHVEVYGYVWFIHHNQPFKSSYILDSENSIDTITHDPSTKQISAQAKRKIYELFQ